MSKKKKEWTILCLHLTTFKYNLRNVTAEMSEAQIQHGFTDILTAKEQYENQVLGNIKDYIYIYTYTHIYVLCVYI